MRPALALQIPLCLAACAPEQVEDTAPELPDDDTDWQDSAEPWEFVDSGGGLEINDVPTHTLTIRQWGTWTLSPPAAQTYTSLSGELFVQEYLDGYRPDTGDSGGADDTGLSEEEGLVCDLVYTLAGVPVEVGSECTGCDFAFQIQFVLTAGDASTCHDPNLPVHEAEWTLGFNPTLDQVMYDYGDAGVWFAWFGASMSGDVVSYLWEVDVGVEVEEEEE